MDVRRKPFLIAALLILILLLYVRLRDAQAKAEDIYPSSYRFTTFDFPAASSTFALGINDRGQIVGTYVGTGGTSHGFLRSGNNFTTIVDAGEATGINNLGEIVGWRIDSHGFFHGFAVSGESSVQLDVPGATFTVTYGVNDQGESVGYFNSYDVDGLQNRGFVASGPRMTTIDVPGAFYTLAAGLNSRGEVVGTYSENNGNIVHGFLYLKGNFTTIDVPGAWLTEVNGINDRGQYVGLYVDQTGLHGFLNRGRFTRFDMPLARATVPYGINNRGQVVGFFTDEKGRSHGFLASPNNPFATAGPD